MTRARDLASGIAIGSTANRPTGFQGQLYYDTTLDNLYQKNATQWQTAGSQPAIPYEFIVVAGGGGAGGSSADFVAGGGGAGAGGVMIGTSQVLPSTSYTITVGAGGSGGSSGNFGTKGINSVALTSYIGIGGGAGRDADDNTTTASDGGSSGGASGSAGGAAGIAQQTSYLNAIGYGYTGGTKNDSNAGSFAGGGGGGAGGNASGRTPGPGIASSITGSSVTYAAGGYGNGTSNFISAGVSGTANRGNGGNGAANGNATGGNGGSGVVIVRYADSYPDISTIAPGLTFAKTTPTGYKVYTFTAGTGTVTI